jgi:hypothetical protein
MIHNLSRISNLLKTSPEALASRRHLMLAGLSQDVFLKEWGVPEIQISLDNLEGHCGREVVAVDADATGKAVHSVWIYKTKNRVFFFTRKKLVSHFKWSEFRNNRIADGLGDASVPVKKFPALFATTLSLVA